MDQTGPTAWMMNLQFFIFPGRVQAADPVSTIPYFLTQASDSSWTLLQILTCISNLLSTTSHYSACYSSTMSQMFIGSICNRINLLVRYISEIYAHIKPPIYGNFGPFRIFHLECDFVSLRDEMLPGFWRDWRFNLDNRRFNWDYRRYCLWIDLCFFFYLLLLGLLLRDILFLGWLFRRILFTIRLRWWLIQITLATLYGYIWTFLWICLTDGTHSFFRLFYSKLLVWILAFHLDIFLFCRLLRRLNLCPINALLVPPFLYILRVFLFFHLYLLRMHGKQLGIYCVHCSIHLRFLTLHHDITWLLLIV